jgi:hypothetical protein
MLDQIIELSKSSVSRSLATSFIPTGSSFGLKEDTIVLFLEMMTWQVDVLRQEFDQYFVFEEVKTFHFNIRIVKATLK